MLGGYGYRFTYVADEYEFATNEVNLDVAGVLELSLQNLLADLVFDFSLDSTAKRSCSKAWLPTNFHKTLLGRIGELEG